jgi:hypothetical protein
MRTFQRATLVALLSLAAGCTGTAGGSGRNSGGNGSPTGNNGTGGQGSVGEPGSGGQQPGTGGGPGAGTGGQSGTAAPGVVPGIRRLSHPEYNQTLADVIQTSLVTQANGTATAGPADTFALDSIVEGFDNARAVLAVTPSLAGQYAATARRVVEDVAGQLGALAPCAGGDESVCASDFVRSFGERLFRRPVREDEIGRYGTLFQVERARSDYAESIQILLEAMLQSPQFLYRSEYGAPGPAGTRVLDPFETATLLSYTFWGAPPDADLIAAAKANALGSAAEREVQARRLLASPRARKPLERFFTQWTMTTNLSTVVKDNQVYPAFDSAMRQSYVEAQASFIQSTLLDGDGTIGTILTGDTGLLQQPWFLTVHAHPGESFPIARGKFVRTRLLCQVLPVPSAELMVMPVDRDPNFTTKERFEAHSANPACAGCHALIDPIGFGFEQYDGIGIYRTEENGKPVDNLGDLTATEDANGPFRGPAELGTRLAASAEVQRCIGNQAFRFAFGHEQSPADVTAIAPVLTELKASYNNNIRELFVLMAKSDRWVTRAAQ